MSVWVPYHLTTLPVSSQQGLDAHKKPAKYPVMAANTCFNFAWLSRCQQLLSFGYDAGQVFRMDSRLPTSDTRFPWGKTCVIMQALVQELCRPVRSSAPEQGGNRIDDLPKLILRLLDMPRSIRSPLTELEFPVAVFPLIARGNCFERVPVLGDLTVFNAE